MSIQQGPRAVARLVLAEDHAMMAQGLQAMLEPRYEVVETVQDGSQVVPALLKHKPDILLLDLSLPNRSGFEILADLDRLKERPLVVVVTMHARYDLAEAAFRLGASAFVPKDAPVEELRTAIEDARSGRQHLSPRIRKSRRKTAPGLPSPVGFERLTPRQQQIVRLIGKGKSSLEIAEALGVSPHTVHFHRKLIRKRLDVHSDREMTLHATMALLLEPERD